MNLNYSKDLSKDYETLSEGRKAYITKRANKKDMDVDAYLKDKYIMTPFSIIKEKYISKMEK